MGAVLLAGPVMGLAPAGLAGQSVHIVHPTIGKSDSGWRAEAVRSDRLSFEAWAGAMWDAYRNEGGDGRPAWIGAVRLSYDVGAGPVTGRGWRIVGELARAEAGDAGTAVLQDSLQVGFRTEWWLATAGVEWDILGGWTGLSLEGRGGAAWLEREIVRGDSIPPATPGTTPTAEPEPLPAVVFGLTAWRHVSHTVQLRLHVEDVITDPFEALEHSPAVGLGVRLIFQ